MCKILLTFLFLITLPLAAQAQENALIGLWQTEDKDAVIAFAACEEDRYCGSFYWLSDEDPAHPSLDDKNRNKDLRTRPLCGLTFLGGFKDQGKGVYEKGWLYSPRHGSSFNANLKLIDHDTLELRGYVFTPIFGGTQRWKRVTAATSCESNK